MNLKLKELSNICNTNIKRMKMAYDKGDKELHSMLCIKEKKLYHKQVWLMKKYGVYVEDPCPLKSNRTCSQCEGWYNDEPNKFYKHIPYSFCKKEDATHSQCKLKLKDTPIKECL